MKQKKKKFNNLSDIPLVILAGGKGSRLHEYTKKIPKPLIRLNNKPLIEIIINHYENYGVKKFIIAGGYKYRLFQKYFKQKKNIVVVNTGLNSLTGKRIKKNRKISNGKKFFFNIW